MFETLVGFIKASMITSPPTIDAWCKMTEAFIGWWLDILLYCQLVFRLRQWVNVLLPSVDIPI